MRAADGNIYGTSALQGGGTIFRLSLQGVVTVLHRFGLSSDGSLSHDGSDPIGLAQASDGRFYGTTAEGGFGIGTAFVMDSAGATTTLHRFTFGADGSTHRPDPGQRRQLLRRDGERRDLRPRDDFPPRAFGQLHGHLYLYRRPRRRRPLNVVQGRDGRLYGTAAEANRAPGVIFRVTLDGNFTVLHTFDWARDGGNPKELVAGPDGNFTGRPTVERSVEAPCFGPRRVVR